MQLTRSFIIKKSQLAPFLLHQEDIIQQSRAPYYLLIYSTHSLFIKITIYPINTIPVIKLIISGIIITQKIVEDTVSFLQTLHSTLIHTSGIVSKEKQNVYEMFFTGNPEKILPLITQKISEISGLEYSWDIITF
jgi:hypothetical protein